jgi:hypothetical protein
MNETRIRSKDKDKRDNKNRIKKGNKDQIDEAGMEA